MTNPNVRLLEVFPGLVLRFEIDSNNAVHIWEVTRYRDWGLPNITLRPHYGDDKKIINSLFPNGYYEPPKLTDPEPEKVEWKEVKG